jgi:D-mannonate dehydratase
MAQPPRSAQQAQKEEEKQGQGGPRNSAATDTWERHGEAVQRQTERVVEAGAKRIQQATEASAAAASGALRSGAAVAGDAQEITAAWARYAEEVMRHTSEASQALLRARTFAEMFEVQAKLLRENMQSFLDQSVRVAEAAGRMATRPFNAIEEGSGRRSRD